MIINLLFKSFYLLHFSGIIGNGLLDTSDSALFSATDVSMATLIPLVATSMDGLAVVNATTVVSHISVGKFHPESSSSDPLMIDASSSSSSSSSLFPLDATPTPTADWLMSFSTMSALTSEEPQSTNTEAGKKRGFNVDLMVPLYWWMMDLQSRLGLSVFHFHAAVSFRKRTLSSDAFSLLALCVLKFGVQT